MERRAAVSCSSVCFSSLRISLSLVQVGRRVMGIISAPVQGCRSSLKEISGLVKRSSTASDLRTKAAALSPSPWLMLRPASCVGGVFHRFYTFVDKKEVVELKAVGAHAVLRSYKPLLNCFVGSSHGWLASYNPLNRTTLFSHPVHGLSLDFPTLADTPSSGEHVSHVAFSSPPDHTDCRALMIYGPDKKLALAALACSGGRWSPIDNNVGRERTRRRRKYENVVYSSRRGTFFCLTIEDGRHALESWDVSNPDSPRIDWTLDNLPDLEDLSYKRGECLNINYLVFDEEEDHLYLVVRRAIVRKLPCGAYNPSNIHYTEYRVKWGGCSPGHAHKTVDFVVYKIDIERKEVSCMINSLDGLALFVGVNQPVAVRVRSSQLQPNAIYFTDLPEFATEFYSSHDIGDNGIFNYESKTFLTFLHSYPVDVRSGCLRKLMSVPLSVWYTPTTTM